MIHDMTQIPSVRAYLNRIGAEIRSMRVAVIKEMHGSYWKDVAIIRLEKTGTVIAPEDHAPTDSEIALIKAECAQVQWPEVKPVRTIENAPDDIKDCKPENLFVFRNPEGMITFVQVRKEIKDGGKAYIPWSYWSDDVWRKTEPEGKLPLWGLDRIKDNLVVFIHEGAKAAKFISDMVEEVTEKDEIILKSHPWKGELSGAAHVGWTGGALSPHRTDWSELQRLGIKRAYIVSDNDKAGISAVSAIAQKLNFPAFHLQFTADWPISFDLADKFPDKMFKDLEGVRRYIGPSFRSCIHPATWATDMIVNTKGRPTAVLRSHFAEQWAYIDEADSFVCVDMPEIHRSEKILNNMLAGFSHVKEISKLLVSHYTGRTAKFCYRPDKPPGQITDKTTSAINLHTPTRVKFEDGSPKPFLDFMDYMFPIPEERHQVLRWCATLIDRPEIRMHFGMLLISESQGVGKTTLGSSILSPLVGVHNCSWPTETDIVDSPFNEWLAHKRLLVVNEIYSGASYKAYHKLKSIVTDSEIHVNQKFQKPYPIDNWAHVLACSNSKRALRVEEDDRRWLYPSVVETPWTQKKFTDFRNWLDSGGIGIIRTWARDFGNYVMPGERPMMTESKREMIDGSRSDAQREAINIGMALQEFGSPAAIGMGTIVDAIRAAVQGRVNNSDYELKKAMMDVTGVKVYSKRMKIGGKMQYVITNSRLNDLLLPIKDDDRQTLDLIRSSLKAMDQITEEPM